VKAFNIALSGRRLLFSRKQGIPSLKLRVGVIGGPPFSNQKPAFARLSLRTSPQCGTDRLGDKIVEHVVGLFERFVARASAA
jgi:hypothetical protein